MGKKRGKFVKEGKPFVLTVDFGDTASERLVRAPGQSAWSERDFWCFLGALSKPAQIKFIDELLT